MRVASSRPTAASSALVSAKRPERDARWIAIKDLLLDGKNPRIPPGYENATQAELLKLMARLYRPKEVGQSLAEDGFWPEEPLVAIPAEAEGGRTGRFIVVEGNRRLTALRLLTDPDAASNLGLSDWAAMASSVETPLERAFVVIHPLRETVNSYLGYRHITGILKWEPDAKARWIASLVGEGKRTFAEVAREIGSTSPTVRDNYVTHHLVRQAEGLGVDVGPVEEDFSVLYRGLSSPGIRGYIGVDLSKTPKQLAKPVPASKSKTLVQLLSWLYGDVENAPALRDSRQLDELGEILAHPKAVQALEASRDIDFAYELTGGEERRVVDNLETASFHLDEALGQVHRHVKSKTVAAAVEKCAHTMVELTRHFPASRLQSVGK